jgi:hypothetical protein
LMLTDTLVTYYDRPWSFASKFALLAHCTAILCARGPSEMRTETSKYLEQLYLPAGAEGAALVVLPDFLPRLYRGLRSKYGNSANGEVVLAGWSPTRQRFAGWYFSYRDDFHPHELQTDAVHWLPQSPDYRRFQPARFDDRLVALARAQHAKIVQEQGDRGGVGGDLIACDLSINGARIWKAARLAGYDELVARMAANEEAAEA